MDQTNGVEWCVLVDGGSNTNMISPEFATVAKTPAIELQEQMTLQLAVTGSRSKINYGTWVPVKFGPINADIYFDITNIKGYNAIWVPRSFGNTGYPRSTMRTDGL